MPVSTLRTIRLPKSDYQRCLNTQECAARTGADYTANTGRRWTGNQRRKRRKFNPPTAIDARTFVSNTDTMKQGICGCGTLPTFSVGGPLGPGTGAFGDSSSTGNAVRSVQARALANFVSNAGLGVTAGELVGTGRMLNDRLTAVVRILNALRKRDIKTAASVLYQHTGYNTSGVEARLRARPTRTYADRASSFWLETSFGWVPLLQSIHDTLRELDRDRSTRRRARASNGHTKSGVTAEFRTASGNRFSALGLTNPAEIAWDLVPFSFVIDWFIPIGASIRFLGTKSLTKQIYQWTSREFGNVYYTGSYLGATPGVLMRKNTSYVRSVSIPSAATFTFRMPSSWWHAVTSASLIQSLRPR